MTADDWLSQDADNVVARIDVSRLADQSVLVTGASGLVGSHILATFASVFEATGARAKVYACTNRPPPPHLLSILRRCDARLYTGDLSQEGFISSLPSADLVFHSAGYGQPGMFMSNPRTTLAINTTGTFGLLRCVRAGGRFLFLSSSEVYSGSIDVPYKEEMIGTSGPLHPRACYIEGKRCGESIVNAHRELGMNAFSARLALAYGPGTKQDDRRVLNSFIQRALVEKKVVMMDSGLAMRTYCYVSDAIEILFRIILDGTRPVYNVGGTSRTSIRALGELVAKIAEVPFESPASTIALAGAPDDVWLDMNLVKSEFSKGDFVSLEAGLRRTISWQRGLYARTLA